jgi:hypothetical protein
MNIGVSIDIAAVIKQSVCMSRRFVCLASWQADIKTSPSPPQSSKLNILQSSIKSK